MIPSNKIPQLSLSDEILNLLFQVVTFILVMPMVPMEVTVFILIALIRISFHLLWPLQGRIVLDLHEHLIEWGI